MKKYLWLALIPLALYAQTTFNMLVVSSAGQFVNARIGRDIYIDFASTPPELRVKFPTNVAVKPSLGVDGVFDAVDTSWSTPATAPVGGFAVTCNGLRWREGNDYTRSPTNPRKIIVLAPSCQTAAEVLLFDIYP